MEVSDYLHVLPAFFPVPIEYEAKWGPRVGLDTLKKREVSSVWSQTLVPRFRAQSPVIGSNRLS